MRTTLLAATAIIGFALSQAQAQTNRQQANPGYNVAAAEQSAPVRVVLASTDNNDHSWATFDPKDHTRAAEGDDYES